MWLQRASRDFAWCQYLLLEPWANGKRVWCAGQLVVLTPLTVLASCVLAEGEFSNTVHRLQYIVPNHF